MMDARRRQTLPQAVRRRSAGSPLLGVLCEKINLGSWALGIGTGSWELGGNWLAGRGTGFSAVGPLFNGDHSPRHTAISRWSREGIARRALRCSAPSARVFVITHLLAIRIAGDVDDSQLPTSNSQ